MRKHKIIHNITQQYQSEIHKSHYTFLNLAVDAVARGAALTCASIGRYLDSDTTEKHSIKRVDNMLSSQLLYRERQYFYRAIASKLITPHSKPMIIIDWSSTNPTRSHHILRASLVMHESGRALTLYEENHPEKLLTHPKVHKKFLMTLKSILPSCCTPVVMTDAGFKANWFKLILELGWDYIGRVRGNLKYREYATDKAFIECSSVYQSATSRAKSLGKIELTKRHRVSCYASIIKKKIKGRKKITTTGKDDRGSESRKNAKRAAEPWFIVSSIDNFKKVLKAYQFRMQIEESFRDLKSTHFGMALKHTRTLCQKRLDILLLIATLTHFILFLMGTIAEQAGWAKDFIANTIKKRRVISQVYLATRLWKKNRSHECFSLLRTFEVAQMLSF